ncbi:MAG TPA: threonine synthase [Chloroflexota bacterium]|nr:threonine synthase [Chloroflexota bacterium]
MVHDLDALRSVISRSTFDKRLGSRDILDQSGVWRFRELVYSQAGEAAVTAPVGNTNLYSSDRVSAWTGAPGLRMKHEGENPTGSFKDRGMTVGVTHARITGSRVTICASTGNTSSSLAAYAAKADMRALVLIPGGEGDVARGKLSQALAYGARTARIRGDFDAAMSVISQIAGEPGVYVLNSINPFRLEGQKSIVYEMLQQLDWKVPDWIVVPGGNLGNTSAFGKAIDELCQLGLIDRRPRLAVIQAAGANPFFQAFQAGFPATMPSVKARTIATAIQIGAPVNYLKARRSILLTDGVVEEVTDREIMDAKAQVDAAGIGCEPASAASVAGTRKLVAAGIIQPGDSVVAILTGHILKDPDATINYHLGRFSPGGAYANNPFDVEPSLDEVRRLLWT